MTSHPLPSEPDLAALREAATSALDLIKAWRETTPGGAVDVWHANGKHWDDPTRIRACRWCQVEAALRTALAARAALAAANPQESLLAAQVGQAERTAERWAREGTLLPSEPDLAALAEALHDAMCDISHHDRPPARCSNWAKYPNIAASVLPRFRAALAAANPRPRVLSEAELAEMTAAAIDPATAPERLERLNATLAAARSSPAPAEGLDDRLVYFDARIQFGMELLAWCDLIVRSRDDLQAEMRRGITATRDKIAAEMDADRVIRANLAARLAPPSPADPEKEPQCTCAGPTSDGGHRAFCDLRAPSLADPEEER